MSNKQREQEPPALPLTSDEKMSWLDRNGVVVAGWTCFAAGSLLCLFSLATFMAFIPFFACTLVFGITAVIRRQFWQGMMLIFAAILLSSFVFAVSLVLQYGVDIRDYQKYLKDLKQMFTPQNSTLPDLEQMLNSMLN